MGSMRTSHEKLAKLGQRKGFSRVKLLLKFNGKSCSESWLCNINEMINEIRIFTIICCFSDLCNILGFAA